jgi:hypothetical protein
VKLPTVFFILAGGFTLWLPSLLQATETVAVCSLVVDGEEVWNGKCCVSETVDPMRKLPDVHAEGWQACLYARRHPENANLPTYQQKCLGPWINLWQEKDESPSKVNNYSAYWSVRGGCHGGETFSARRTGNVYQGDKFIFGWHEPR